MEDDLDISLSQEYHKIEQKKRNQLLNRRVNNSELSISSYNSISPLHSPKPKPTTTALNEQTNRQLQAALSENQQLTIENNNFQAYIKELADYINDSSGKYSDNIQKYGIAYKELYIKYTNLLESSQQEILLLKNQLQAERESSYKKQLELSQLQKSNKSLKEDLEEQYRKSKGLKEQMEQQWQEHLNNRTLWNNILSGVEEETKGYKQNIFDLKNQLKSKEQQIQKHLQQIYNTNQQLQKREALPEKIIDKEKEILVKDADMRNDKSKIVELQKALDIMRLQLVRSEKEREELRVRNTQLSTDFDNLFRNRSKQSEDRWREKQFSYQLQLSKLKQEKQSLKKELSREIEDGNQWKQRIQSKQREILSMGKRMKSEIQQKQSYLSEFKTLKSNYQEVINNLEKTIEQLQHKLWTTSDRNRELEFQVDRFRDITKQLEDINDKNKGATDLMMEEVEARGLGDPIRLLRGEEERKQSQKYMQSKASAFKNSKKEQQEVEGSWQTLMAKISSM